MDLTPEEQQIILERRKKQKALTWTPPKLEEIDDAVKIEGFERVYSLAVEIFENRKDINVEDSDYTYWCKEKVMEMLEMFLEPGDPTLYEIMNS